MKESLQQHIHILATHVWIGKAGLTDSVIAEIRKHAEKKPLVKIKLLAAALVGKEKKQFAEDISKRTGCKLIQQRGNVLILQGRVSLERYKAMSR